MSRNSYPKLVRNRNIKKCLSQKKTAVQKVDESVIKIWIRLPYLDNKDEERIKTFIRKLKHCFKTNFKIAILYNTKCTMVCSVKDRIPTHQKSNVIYQINFPGCGKDYVAKTERCVIKRLNKYSSPSGQPIFQYLKHCEKLLEIMILYQLPDIDTDVSPVISQAHIVGKFLINGIS